MKEKKVSDYRLDHIILEDGSRFDFLDENGKNRWSRNYAGFKADAERIPELKKLDQDFIISKSNGSRIYLGKDDGTLSGDLEGNTALRTVLLEGEWDGGFIRATRCAPLADPMPSLSPVIFNSRGEIQGGGGVMIPELLTVSKIFPNGMRGLSGPEVVDFGEFEDGCFDDVLLLTEDGKLEKGEHFVILPNGRGISDKGFKSHQELKDTISALYHMADPDDENRTTKEQFRAATSALLRAEVPKENAELIIDNAKSFAENYAYIVYLVSAVKYKMIDGITKKAEEIQNDFSLQGFSDFLGMKQTYDEYVSASQEDIQDATNDLEDFTDIMEEALEPYKKEVLGMKR